MVTYVQLNGSRFYIPASRAADPGRARIAFIATKAGPKGPSIDPAASLLQGAIVLFPTLNGISPVSFANLAINQLDTNGGSSIRIAVFVPGVQPGDYQLDSKQLVKTDKAGLTTIDTQLVLGTKRATDPTGNGHWRTILPIATLLRGAGDAIEFVFPAGATSLGIRLDQAGTLAPLSQGHRTFVLDLEGPARGTVQFPIDVDSAIAESMGLGMRLFQLGASSGGASKVRPHSYPLFDINKVMRFDARLDFSSPYEEEALADGTVVPRTVLHFQGNSLASNLHAAHGHIVSLRPEGEAGLRLVRSPLAVRTKAGKLVITSLEHYLAPYGLFEPAATGHSGAFRLTLGLSNTESLLLEPDAGDRLSFSLGAALVGDPTTLKALLRADDDLLDADGACQTAWVQLTQSNPKVPRPLAIDPEGMPGYRPSGLSMLFEATNYEAPAAQFPLLPLLGLARSKAPGGSPAERIELERGVIARARRGKLVPAPVQLLAGAKLLGGHRVARSSLIARMPQGYLAERAQDGAPWSAVTFGRTGVADPLLANGVRSFGLVATDADSGKALQDLFAKNRVFLVTTPSTLINEHHFRREDLERIVMAGWVADASPDAVLVIKFDDRPLSSLIDDIRNWTSPDSMCPDVGRAKRVLAAAVARRGDLYARLNARLTDPAWNGVLLLEASLDGSGLPDQLKALAPTISKLPVHHIGIDLSAIGPDGEAGAWPTAVFGLIDYEEPGAPSVESNGVEMALTALHLRVENDTIDRFDCELKIKLRSLFDVATTNPNAVLTLQGLYESRVDQNGVKRETYALSTKGTYEKHFNSSYILRLLTITHVQLVTTLDAGKLIGRFLIDGCVTFNELGDLDLLGIDALDFSGFSINFGLEIFVVSFDYPSLKFDFDRLNRSASGKRPGSLLSKFPLKLRGFNVGSLSLPKLGFLNFGEFHLPGGITPATEFRFGFDFDLDLGSLGNLAKKLERFRLRLLMGWKPEDADGLKNSFAFGFCLDLGEGAGGIDLGIQGILRIAADRFNLKKEDGVIILSADKCVLEALGQRLPTQEDQRFTLFLFADIGKGMVERPGWYASFEDQSASPPVKLDYIALGQRVNVNFDDISTTREAIAWLEDQTRFKPGDTKGFVKFASKDGKVSYAPARDWFVATRGELFETVRFALLLRDPDLYGAYVGLPKAGSKDDLFSLDLLYERLGDGVGRYSVEVVLPEALRTFDVGAFAITIGAIRASMFTDGGFEIDLGFPKGVDYSRSFVVQGGPFIGKGGFYIGRVPREAVPALNHPGIGQVFRAGVALRIGLGREFERGPIRAGLSVSVFGRIEGAIAKSPQGYYLALQGEVGIIAEVEGSVDLRLIRARLLVRVWVATGITIVTNIPVLLYCEAGVSVSLEFEIGRIKIFGKTISIKITLSYSTTLRFEWVLPVTLKPIKPALLATPTITASPWTLPDFGKLGVAQLPVQLQLVVDGSRSTDGGRTTTVLVPSVVWISGDGLNTGQQPFETLGRALVAWAAIRCDPTAANADAVFLSKKDGLAGAVSVGRLRQELSTFETMDADVLDQFLAWVLAGSNLDLVKAGQKGDAYVFPVPPGLKMNFGNDLVDLAKEGIVTDEVAANLLQHLDGQFSELTPRSPKSEPGFLSARSEPIASRLFRGWCQMLALVTLEELDQAFDASGNVNAKVQLSTLWPLVAQRWIGIAGRVGRFFYGGLRVNDAGVHAPLLARAGLHRPLPSAGGSDVTLVGIGGTGWLALGNATLAIDVKEAARLASVAVSIPASRPAETAATRLVARGFVQGPFTRLARLGAQAPSALLSDLGADLRRQLTKSAPEAFPGDLGYFARAPQAQEGQSALTETALSGSPARVTVFDMAIERIAVASQPGQPGSDPSKQLTAFLPNCFQIAGASEAERRALDALLLGEESDVLPRLAGARIALAWSEGTDSSRIFEDSDPTASQVLLARSTVSVERRPFELSALSRAGAEEIFRATLAPKDSERLAFLLLLQRAAIVNSGGTYLIVPDAVGEALKALFATSGNRARLSVIVALESKVVVPRSAVNALLVDDARDLALLDAKPRRNLVARLTTVTSVVRKQYPGLIEAVALRPPGTEMVRIWRKAPPDPPAGAPADEVVAAHLETLFDMLEFEVADENGAILLDFEDSLPLASESVFAETMQQWMKDEFLAEAKAAGFEQGDRRYDLLLPLSAIAHCDPTRPYAAVGKSFRVRFGWRDIYGNRLGTATQELPITLLYRDALVPVGSWPVVEAWVVPGAPASGGFELRLDTPATGVADLSPDQRVATVRELRRVIAQLDGPEVRIRVETGLSASYFDVAPSLIMNYLELVIGYVEGGAKPPMKAVPFTTPPIEGRPFLPLAASITVERLRFVAPDMQDMGVSRTNETLLLRDRTATFDSPADAAERSRLATDVRAAFIGAGKLPRYWVGVGTDEAGESTWWAVDSRIVPARDKRTAVPFAPPPLARAALSVALGDVLVVRKNGDEYSGNLFAKAEEQAAAVEAVDRDVDAMMSQFLARVDRFLSPVNAPVTAQARKVFGATTPFERVAAAKRRMLGHSDQQAPLLQYTSPIWNKDVAATDGQMEAVAVLREACATELERFATVASTIVIPLESSIPAGWFGGEPRPKLYGHLRFGSGGATPLGLRALTRGIPLREGAMHFGISVLPDAPADEYDLAKWGPVSYDVTHVEQVIDAGGRPGGLAPSSWLSLVPINPAKGEDALPSLQLSKGPADPIKGPAPVRAVPKTAELKRPTAASFDGDVGTDYPSRIASARRWRYLFEAGAEFKPGANDEVCGRLVYNLAIGSSVKLTETPAAPLFPLLFPSLVRFEARTAPYWPAIESEAARRAKATPGTGGDPQLRFENACERFAEAVEAVVDALTDTSTNLLSAAIDEDRFVVRDKTAGKGRISSIQFLDHLSDPAVPWTPVLAGEGHPDLTMDQVVEGVNGTTYIPGTPKKAKKQASTAVGAEFAFANDDVDPAWHRRRIGIGRLDALRLQSVWVAASIRRNAELAGHPANPVFVYRTAEIFLHDLIVPNLLRRDGIVLETPQPETLAARLTRALDPVFKGAQRSVPAQVRFDYESGRMSALVDAVGLKTRFLPEPDPKLQFANISIGTASDDLTVPQLAQNAAVGLRAVFAREPLGMNHRGSVVVGVMIRTADDRNLGQPLLRLTRLVVPLAGVSDL